MPSIGETGQRSAANLISSLYYAAGACSGLIEGYILICKTIADELTGGKGILGLMPRRNNGKGEAGLKGSDLKSAILGKIVSVPKHLAATDLATNFADGFSNASLQPALPAGLEFHLDVNGDHADELHEAYGFRHTNGHRESFGFDSPRHSFEAGADFAADANSRSGRRAYPRTGVVFEGSWWSNGEDEVWTAGAGPIRHRRPGAARLCLSKFLMRHPLK